MDYFEDLVEQNDGSNGERKKLEKFKNNLEDGMGYCIELAQSEAYQNENLASVPPTVGNNGSNCKHLSIS